MVPNKYGCHHYFLPLSHLGHFSVLSPLPPNPRGPVIFFSLSQLLPNGKSPSPCSQHTQTLLGARYIHFQLTLRIFLLFNLRNQPKGNKSDKLGKVNRLKKFTRRLSYSFCLKWYVPALLRQLLRFLLFLSCKSACPSLSWLDVGPRRSEFTLSGTRLHAEAGYHEILTSL